MRPFFPGVLTSSFEEDSDRRTLEIHHLDVFILLLALGPQGRIILG
jgi:hypothetical protein